STVGLTALSFVRTADSRYPSGVLLPSFPFRGYAMRTLLSLGAVLVALVGSSSELLAAPVPADKPQPSIDGKYTLLSVSTPDDRAGGGGGFPGGGVIGPGGGRVMIRPGLAATYMAGPATITKNQIT